MIQSEFINKFNNENREKFNEFFFSKSDDDIIEDLKKLILSCEREQGFIIKVLGFNVIEDYTRVQECIKADKAINIANSDLKVLQVLYYIAYGDESDQIVVNIAVPKIYPGGYCIVNGHKYFPLYQLVDGSTYNNTNKNSKTETITLRTISTASAKMIRNFHTIKSLNGMETKCVDYSINVFRKKVNVFNYFLAKFGFDATLRGFNFSGLVRIYDSVIEPSRETEDAIIFKSSNKKFYSIIYNKYVFENERVFQSLIYTLYDAIKSTKLKTESPYDQSFWVKSLGSYFIPNNHDQYYGMGISVLYSLEMLLDFKTKDNIRLPLIDKDNVYLILKWMMTEFTNIRLKNNTDVSTKRIRWSEWIASLYINKINPGLFRISNINRRNKHNDNLKRITQVINTKPLALVKLIIKSSLSGFNNIVNDRDLSAQLKYTIKGPSGPGEKNSKNISASLRMIDPTQIGIIDINTSSSSDPGISGLLCPLNTNITDNGFFNDSKEPNMWDKSFKEKLKNNVVLKPNAVHKGYFSDRPFNDINTGLVDKTQQKRNLVININNLGSNNND